MVQHFQNAITYIEHTARGKQQFMTEWERMTFLLYTIRCAVRRAQNLKESAGTPDKAVYFFVLPVKYLNAPSPVNNISEQRRQSDAFYRED